MGCNEYQFWTPQYISWQFKYYEEHLNSLYNEYQSVQDKNQIDNDIRLDDNAIYINDTF